MFKVNSKKLQLRWGTLSIERSASGKIVADVILDWELDRQDKSKHSNFVVYHTLGINPEGRISSIYENILKKQ